MQALVIEDNTGDFVLIQEYLLEETEQAEIERATTFADAKERLTNSNFFDVILLDLDLPDASGEVLVQDVVGLAQQTPVVVLTGYENEQFGLKTLNMGAADYLLKDELNPFLLSKSISYSIERNRINQSLRESEKQYRALFDLSPLPKWVFDAKTLKFLDVNQRAIAHYGYSREEFLEMTIKDICPQEDLPILEQTLETSLNSPGFHESGIHRHKKKNGDIIQVDIRSTLITYGNRKAKIVVANDITDRLETEKKLALSEKRFKSLVQGGSDLIAILDEEANYKYVAPTTKSVLGVTAEEFIGTNALDYIHPDDKERVADLISDLEDEERIEIQPFRFRDAGGNWRWIETTITNMLDNPAVEGLVVNSRDVTENIKREHALQESLERHEYVTKATDDVVYDWDIVEDILEWDDSFHEKFAYDIEKGRYTIDDWAQNVHPQDLEQANSSLNRVLHNSSESKWEHEYRFQKKDGSYATVFERGFIIRDDDGNALRMIGSLQDITERKEYEEKLEELALVASKTTDIIIMTTPDDRITWVNDAFEQLTGYSFEEAVGENPGELLQGPETDRQTAQRLGEAVRDQKSVQDVILNYTKDGRTYWLDITIDPIFDDAGNCEGFIAIEKDVTEQIDRQRELQESVERYDIVSKATSDTIWDLNLETDTVQYNSNIYNMFGYEKQQVEQPAEWWRDKLHPEDREDVIRQMEEALEADSDRFQMEYRFQSAEGKYKHIYDRAFIVNDEEGNPIRMIGAMQDVTQQREEQKWLQLFQSAIASTKESVAIIEFEPTDLPGRQILYVNQAFCEMTGYDSEEVKGETLDILNGPKTSEQKRNELRNAIEKRESCEVELINYTKDGEEFWVRVSLTLVEGANSSQFWVCVGRDITEEKKQQRTLKQSLEEKETLLLEIHHRVKNNLAVVSGMMQLQAFEEDDESFKEKLFDGVARIQTMGNIHELLYQSESFTELAFHENLKKLTNQIVNTFSASVSLQTNFELENVNLNINQAIPCSLIVNEVITNVLKHAFKEQDRGILSISMSQEEEKIRIQIKDNGKGLPADFNRNESVKSLGLKLIDTLAMQLEADYEYASLDQGTGFTLEFQKAKVKGVGSAHLFN